MYIEALPGNYEALVRNRLDGVNIHAALCDKSMELHFTKSVDNLSPVEGFIEFMPEKFLNRFHPRWKDPAYIKTLPTVQCASFTKLFQLIDVNTIDLWILDVEGAELSVLQSVDFSKIKIKTVIMECNGYDKLKDKQKMGLLEGNGYSCYIVKNNCHCAHSSFQPSKKP